MNTLATNLHALLEVVLAGIFFGAGLPALFAFGVRFHASGGGPARAGAYACFGIVCAAVVCGVLWIAKAFLAAKLGVHIFGA
ncbi:hypothetical protein AB0H71_11140 [Nocardia sp. NPDC050697]|uniref:hypothetical protein n=1 Tax=Nocardia sp. NPDC050697 TaxID=3155158 RepID=UPI0033C56F91